MAVFLPPPQYDHPFEGHLVVEVLPYYEVDGRCGKAKHGRYDACSWTFTYNNLPACHIVYPKLGVDGVTVSYFIDLVRHETAHCNGWPGTHPNAHFSTPGE